MRFRISLILFLSLGACSAPADLLLVNGRVYTLAWSDPAGDGSAATDAPHGPDGWSPDGSVVAIRDGQILQVGGAEVAKRYRSGATNVIDLNGATVVPGLVDSHTHVIEMGMSQSKLSLLGLDDLDSILDAMRERARTLPAGEWLLAHSFDEGAWADRYPTKEPLDRLFGDRPVYVRGLHGFAGWLNSAALRAAGIGPGTPDPVGGTIVRGADGEPNGMLLNNAVQLSDAAVPPPSDDALDDAVVTGLRIMAAAGYVSVHEAGLDARGQAAIERLAAADRLPIRVYAMLKATETELARKWLAKGPDPVGDSMLTTRAIKGYYDGSLGARGARLLEDYRDQPGHRGVSGEDYGFDRELVAQLADAGFQIGIHAIGDAGNREVLDFYASLQPRADARHRIEHAQVVHPGDFVRFAELGLIASMEPAHCVEDMPWVHDRIGVERAEGAYAWRTFRSNGVLLALNSDLPGSSMDFFYGMHSAVTRQSRAGDPAGGWHPAERLTAEEVLRGYTAWNAYAAHLEDRTGTLEPGKWADITVLNVDPLRLGDEDPPGLLRGRVVTTIVAGRVVYDGR